MAQKTSDGCVFVRNWTNAAFTHVDVSCLDQLKYLFESIYLNSCQECKQHWKDEEWKYLLQLCSILLTKERLVHHTERHLKKSLWQKKFCQHFVPPYHSLTYSLLTRVVLNVCGVINLGGWGRRLHASQTWLITINIISWQDNCGKLSCHLSLSALTGHLFLHVHLLPATPAYEAMTLV